jgi:hypothetical protein
MEAVSILWRRLDTPGHDACRLEGRDDGWQLEVTAVFRHEGVPARLTYHIACDLAWCTQQGRVRGWLGPRPVEFGMAPTAAGVWTLNGAAVPGVAGCVDLDLGFTPATNLPNPAWPLPGSGSRRQPRGNVSVITLGFCTSSVSGERRGPTGMRLGVDMALLGIAPSIHLPLSRPLEDPTMTAAAPPSRRPSQAGWRFLAAVQVGGGSMHRSASLAELRHLHPPLGTGGEAEVPSCLGSNSS